MRLATGQTLISLLGSLAMVLLLVYLALHGLAALGWLPARLRARFRSAERTFCTVGTACASGPDDATPGPAADLSTATPTRRELTGWFFLALFYQWLVLYLAYRLNGGSGAFLTTLYERFTTGGDSPHYLWLAQNGYAAAGENVNLICFYPLYPMALSVLRFLGVDLGAIGMAFSQLCFAGAAVFMRRLTAQTLPPTNARAATLALLLYPFSYFSFGVYTEGLFLLLTLASLYALGRRQWLGAGALAFLAALCRTQGLCLFFAAVFAWLAAPKAERRRPQALALLGAPLGFGCYLLINKLTLGSWFAYVYYQSIAPWYNHADWFGNNLAQQLGMAAEYPGLAPFIYIPQLVLYFLGLAAVAFLLARGGSLPVCLFSTAYFGMSYLSGWLISGSRYMFGFLALYFALGKVRHRWLRWALLGLEGLLLVRYAVYFMQGQAIM